MPDLNTTINRKVKHAKDAEIHLPSLTGVYWKILLPASQTGWQNAEPKTWLSAELARQIHELPLTVQSTERLLVMHLWGDKYDISLMSVGICSIPLFTSIGYTLSITQQHINALTDPVMIVRDAVRRQDVCTDEISPVSILTLYWFCG